MYFISVLREPRIGTLCLRSRCPSLHWQCLMDPNSHFFPLALVQIILVTTAQSFQDHLGMKFETDLEEPEFQLKFQLL